jgi:hypothetical protein
MSEGFTVISIVSSMAGDTKTDAKVVCRLLLALNGERRTMRCTPFSLLR